MSTTDDTRERSQQRSAEEIYQEYGEAVDEIAADDDAPETIKALMQAVQSVADGGEPHGE